jgi:sigma-B regulation protein RsbU (phosphoserine phosphatase)
MRLSALRRVKNSLRVRLFAATVLLLALALGVAVLGFERSANKVVLEAVGSHLAARAREVLEATTRFQTERCLTVSSWSEAEAMQSTLDTGDPKFAEDFLRRTIQDQGGAFSIAALLDTRATVKGAVHAAGEGKRRGSALEQLRGRVVALAPVAAALRGESLSVAIAPSSALDPSDTTSLSLFVAVPVKDFVGDLVGAVVAAVPPAALSRLLAEIEGDDERYVPVVSDAARLVTLSLPGADPARFAPLVEAGGKAGGLERHVDGSGEPVLAVRTEATTSAPGWRALMLVPEQDAYGPIRALRHFLTVAFALVLAGAALASVVALRRAAQPLSDLSASMTRVSGGDLTTRLPEIYSGDLAHLVGSFNTMVTEVARSRDELKRTEGLQKEMQIAQHIQTAILPDNPAVSGFEIAARMKTADDVGGDLYDILAFDDTFWVLIGDVSGHGINSGLVMMMAQAAAYGAVTGNPRCHPHEVVVAVNRVVYENVRRRMHRDDYLTFMVARHLGDGRFVAAGAHQPIFIARAAGNVEVIAPVGPWVGVVEQVGPRVVEHEFRLAEGDSLCLITDGLVEAKDRREQLYGEDRLAALLTAREPLGAAQTLSTIFESVEQFAATQSDDMTAVVIKRKGHADVRA